MPTKTKGRAGITTDPWRRKGEWEHKYPKMSNWRETGPFRKNAAIAWENEQGERGYETSNGGDDQRNPRATRYGYQFDF
ncbi:MAG: hypothetical protein ACR2P4_06500 [Gammaproteobacteria bacterium]